MKGSWIYAYVALICAVISGQAVDHHAYGAAVFFGLSSIACAIRQLVLVK